MLRIYKMYSFNFRRSTISSDLVAAVNMSFSSYPGYIFSGATPRSFSIRGSLPWHCLQATISTS
jgi:hypothetical protein